MTQNALAGLMSAMMPDTFGQGMKSAQSGQMNNALAGGDYGAASQAAFSMGDTNGGLKLAQYGEQQQAQRQQAITAEQQQKAQGMLAFTQNMMQIPEADRGRWAMDNWQQLEPIVGTDFMTFWQQSGGDVSDQSLQEDILAIQTGLGQGPAAPVEGKVVNNRLVDPMTGEVRGDFSDPAKREVLKGADGYSYYQDTGERVLPDVVAAQKGPMVSITNTNGPNQPFGSEGDLPIGGGTKGKEEAVVRGFDGEPVVVPGSKAQLYNKTKNSIEDLSFQNDLIIEDIGRALALSDGVFTTGFTGSIAKGVPGTPAYNLNKVLDGIKANVGFDKLQNMRDNSPTGGALGQVSEWELVLLQSVLGSLEQSQTKEQFTYNLDRLQKVKAEGDRRRREAFKQDFPSLRDYKEFSFDAGQQIKAAPQGAIEMLRGDPSLKEAFDQKYGAGAADKALGGQ